MKRFLIFLAACTLSTGAFADLIVDKGGVDEKEYVYDMHQCSEYADQVKKDERSRSALGGAATGAALGAVGKAIAGGSGSDGAKKGAGIGLAVGVLGGSADRRANQEKYDADRHSVMRNCMTNRGYTVLN